MLMDSQLVDAETDEDSDWAGSSCASSDSGGRTVFYIGPNRLVPAITASVYRGIPRDAEGRFKSSFGSYLHPGQCIPCMWLARPIGCLDGALCRMCHSEHDLSYSQRKRLQAKFRAQRNKLIAEALATAGSAGGCDAVAVKAKLSSRGIQAWSSQMPPIVTSQLEQQSFHEQRVQGAALSPSMNSATSTVPEAHPEPRPVVRRWARSQTRSQAAASQDFAESWPVEDHWSHNAPFWGQEASWDQGLIGPESDWHWAVGGAPLPSWASWPWGEYRAGPHWAR